MAVARLKTSGVDVRLAVSRSLSPERRQQLIAAHAREGLQESQDINRAALGRVPPHDTFVDGRAEAPLTSVNPDRGVIVFRFQLATELFEWIDEMLIVHSPVGSTPKSPEYSKSHLFFADGVQADPLQPQTGEVFVFLNSTPYSRKIERGQSKQAPDGVYEAVAAMAQRRFGNVARIRFGYRAFADGSLASTDAVSALRRQYGKREAHRMVKEERDRRRPAIIVTLN